MPKKFDRKMRAALETLLQDRPLDNITVSDLTTTAGITRPAFYYHFSSVQEYIEDTLEKQLKRVFVKHPDGLDAIPAALMELLEAFKEQSVYVNKIYESQYYQPYQDKLKELLTDVFTERTAEYLKNRNEHVTWRDKRLFIRLAVNSCIELIEVFLSQNMHADPAALMAKYRIYMGRPFSQVLSDFSE